MTPADPPPSVCKNQPQPTKKLPWIGNPLLVKSQRILTRKKTVRENQHNMFLQGLQAGWPICLGYIPIGLAFGVLAQKAGLSPLHIGLMSILVFAGSAQFIAVSMLAAGASAAAIILTTFVVNLRHVLMSSSLAVHLKGERRSKLSLFAYGVTDESFAVNANRFSGGTWDLNRCLVVNHVANLIWFISTVTGGVVGQHIPPSAFGIDYALIAMFICLLVLQLKGRAYVWTGLLAAVLAVTLALLIPGNLYIVLSSVLAASVGAAIRNRKERRR
jgi:4-azaleucine resistance transporter AzlC